MTENGRLSTNRLDLQDDETERNNKAKTKIHPQSDDAGSAFLALTASTAEIGSGSRAELSTSADADDADDAI